MIYTYASILIPLTIYAVSIANKYNNINKNKFQILTKN